MKLPYILLSSVFVMAACSSKPVPTPPSDAPATAVAEPAAPPHEHGPGDDHHHHGPPPEAIEACKDKAVKDKCFFQTPRKDIIRGTCAMALGPHDIKECRPNPPAKKKK